MMYSTIWHPVRRAFHLSMNEYVVLDSIHQLSNNQQYEGWCVMSQSELGKELDLSARTILKIYQTLEKKGLLLRRKKWPSDTAVRPNADFGNAIIAGRNDVAFIVKNKELSLGSIPSKFRLKSGEESSQGVRRKFIGGGEESSHNNISNNITNNITTAVGKNKTFEKLVNWLKGMSDVPSPTGLAKKYFSMFPEVAISRALNHTACNGRVKFTDLCKYYVKESRKRGLVQ